MVKHEIKVELDKTEQLKQIIEKAYFEEGFGGKILGKNHYLKIEKDDDINYSIFKGLNNVTVKIINEEVIDGSLRFIIDDTEEQIKLFPISVYCIKESDRYIFY